MRQQQPPCLIRGYTSGETLAATRSLTSQRTVMKILIFSAEEGGTVRREPEHRSPRPSAVHHLRPASLPILTPTPSTSHTHTHTHLASLPLPAAGLSLLLHRHTHHHCDKHQNHDNTTQRLHSSPSNRFEDSTMMMMQRSSSDPLAATRRYRRPAATKPSCPPSMLRRHYSCSASRPDSSSTVSAATLTAAALPKMETRSADLTTPFITFGTYVSSGDAAPIPALPGPISVSA